MKTLVAWVLSKLAPVPLTPYRQMCALFPREDER